MSPNILQTCNCSERQKKGEGWRGTLGSFQLLFTGLSKARVLLCAHGRNSENEELEEHQSQKGKWEKAGDALLSLSRGLERTNPSFRSQTLPQEGWRWQTPHLGVKLCLGEGWPGQTSHLGAKLCPGRVERANTLFRSQTLPRGGLERTNPTFAS